MLILTWYLHLLGKLVNFAHNFWLAALLERKEAWKRIRHQVSPEPPQSIDGASHFLLILVGFVYSVDLWRFSLHSFGLGFRFHGVPRMGILEIKIDPKIIENTVMHAAFCSRFHWQAFRRSPSSPLELFGGSGALFQGRRRIHFDSSKAPPETKGYT